MKLDNHPPLLKVEHLFAGYGEIQVLQDVHLQIAEGELIALLGSNGAGKTTLNSVLSGLIKPSHGTVLFNSESIEKLHYTKIVSKGLIHVPEGRKIFPNLSVVDNLLLGAYKRANVHREENLAKVFEIFPKLKIRSSQFAGSMSGGEQQMLAIGRGLMAEPLLLILDEPSLGLSPILVEELFELIAQLKKLNLTILLVEQNVGQSLAHADRAYVLENGKICFEGLPNELFNSDTLRKTYLGM